MREGTSSESGMGMRPGISYQEIGKFYICPLFMKGGLKVIHMATHINW